MTATVSPARTPSRDTSFQLCSVARATRTPPICTGRNIATGVSAPVRPTCGRHRQCLDRSRRGSVRAHAKLVLSLDLEQVGNLLENTGDVDILDGVWMLRRSGVCAHGRVPGHVAAGRRRQATCAIDVPTAPAAVC